MKISLCFVLLSFASQYFCTVIHPGIKLSSYEGSQNVLSERQAPVPGNNSLEYCDVYHEDIFHLYHVNLNPNPPEKGKKLFIEASGILKEDIEIGAYVRVEVAYGLIRLLKLDLDLCNEVSHVDLECPLKKGPITISKSVELPANIPPGQYKVFADAYTADDERLICLKSSVKFNI